MEKLITIAEAASKIKNGMTVMVGGFLSAGGPNRIIDALLESGVKDLTIICNDTAFPDKGLGKLIVNHQVKKVITSHIGTNAETGRQMIAGELDVELVPQGTLAERIRCGGAGLGGVLTPTGVGTLVEEGKTKLTFDGVEYLVERALRADMAIVKAQQADTKGNLMYRRAARNFNPLIAMAADFVVAEVDEIVEAGQIDPDLVMTPGVVVDALIVSGGK